MAQRGEFDLIREFFTRSTRDAAVQLGVGDDAALLAVPARQELVVTTDTLVNGRHFPEDAAPYDIGWKALAVNLSDLAAMGAQARWVTLALTLPDSDEEFLRGFSQGFFALAEREGVSLIGGDTTRGPLAITVTAMGLVPAGAALRRSGAQPGDDIYVSGSVGDAGLGLRLVLQQWADDLPVADADFVLQRLHRPEPRLALGAALRGLASSCLDVSDGLAQDLGHVLSASAVGAELDLECLPLSAALAAVDPAFADVLALTSGDDYELLFTAAATQRERIAALQPACRRIGRITAQRGLRLRRDGIDLNLPLAGFQHF
ncbi:MAG TPA: thiamine-phosphate kinase [Moraxellaceae bacterium]